MLCSVTCPDPASLIEDLASIEVSSKNADEGTQQDYISRRSGKANKKATNASVKRGRGSYIE